MLADDLAAQEAKIEEKAEADRRALRAVHKARMNEKFKKAEAARKATMPPWNDLAKVTSALASVRVLTEKRTLEAEELDGKKAALETRQADNRQNIDDLEEQQRQLNARAAEFSGAVTDPSVPGAPNRWAWALSYPPMAETRMQTSS